MSFNPMASGASGVGRKGECTLLYSGELGNKQTRGNAERNRRVDRAIVGVVASEPRCGGGRRGGGASWYDSRDRGGESVGELAGGGRVAECWRGRGEECSKLLGGGGWVWVVVVVVEIIKVKVG